MPISSTAKDQRLSGADTAFSSFEKNALWLGPFRYTVDAGKDIMAAYDAVLPGKPEYANRTSYVIAPGGEIIVAYPALDSSGHVANTLAAVEKWKAGKK